MSRGFTLLQLLLLLYTEWPHGGAVGPSGRVTVSMHQLLGRSGYLVPSVGLGEAPEERLLGGRARAGAGGRTGSGSGAGAMVLRGRLGQWGKGAREAREHDKERERER